MQKKLTKTFIIIFFLISACSNTMEEIKGGLGGKKKTSTDEFLVKKKDPLVLPPKWGDLPVPGQSLKEEVDEATDIEELIQLGKDQKNSVDIEQGGSAEDSILKQLKK